MNEKEEKYYSWFEQEYNKICNISRLLEITKNSWIHEFLNNMNYRYCTGLIKHLHIYIMKYNITYEQKDYIFSVFKIYRKGRSSIIPYKDVQFNTIYAIVCSYIENNNVVMDYLLCGSTFKSSDGEYRHHYNKISYILEVGKDENILNIIKTHVHNQLNKKDISFEVDHIIPKYIDKKYSQDLDKLINDNELTILLYINSWIIFIYKYNSGIVENHINDGYKEAMLAYGDKEFAEKHFEPIKIYRKYIIDYKLKKKISASYKIDIGQKILALTVGEIENLYNIKSATWRELIINKMVNNLIVNNIAPNFALLNNWNIVNINSYNLWSNKSNKIRIDNSDIAKKIVKQIEEARKSTYIIDPISRKEIYISFEMEGLSKAIDIPFEYAEKNIILSNNILAMTLEDTGRTLADFEKLLRSENYINMIISDMLYSYDKFKKFMFDIIYPIYCMNKHLGVMHGDLHLNNITITNKTSFINRFNEPYHKNPHIIYNMNNNIYLFPYFGTNLTIIDFSRGFIHPNKLKELYPNEFDDIMYNQKNKLLQLIKYELPDFYNTYENKLQFSIIKDTDKFFTISQALDIYKYTKNFKSIIEQIKSIKSPNINQTMLEKEAIPKLDLMIDITYNYLVNNYINLFNGNEINNVNCALVIAEKLFNNNLMENYKTYYEGQLYFDFIDYFSSENELKYSMDCYDKLPSIDRLEYLIEHNLNLDEINMGIYNYFKNNKIEINDRILKIQQEIITEKNKRTIHPESVKVDNYSNIS